MLIHYNNSFVIFHCKIFNHYIINYNYVILNINDYNFFIINITDYIINCLISYIIIFNQL